MWRIAFMHEICNRKTHITSCLIKRAAACALSSLLILTIAGCGKSYTYKYRITVSVRDHGKLKAASNVVAVKESIGLDRNPGYAVLCGEAVVIPLQDGKYLFALLKGAGQSVVPGKYQWRSGPTGVLLNRLGLETQWSRNDKGLLKLPVTRTPVDLYYYEMPDFVTFANLRDPITITSVNPENPEPALGNNVHIEKVTLQVTDEKVTRGSVKPLLPWLVSGNAFIDGSRLGERVRGYERRHFTNCHRLFH
jgi:hypothetical protein